MRVVNSLINEFLEQSVSLFPAGSVGASIHNTHHTRHRLVYYTLLNQRDRETVAGECDTSAQTDRHQRNSDRMFN